MESITDPEILFRPTNPKSAALLKCQVYFMSPTNKFKRFPVIFNIQGPNADSPQQMHQCDPLPAYTLFDMRHL